MNDKVKKKCEELLKKECDTFEGTIVSADYIYKDHFQDNKKVYIYITDENGSVFLVTYRLNFMVDKVLGRTTYLASPKTAKSLLELLR